MDQHVDPQPFIAPQLKLELAGFVTTYAGLIITKKGCDMAGFLLRWLVCAVALAVAVWLIPGLAYKDTESLALAALLLGGFNAFLRPVLFWLTLPLTVLTLGVFLLVLNAAMLGLVGWFVPGFVVAGFWPAFFGAIVVGLVSLALSRVAERR